MIAATRSGGRSARGDCSFGYGSCLDVGSDTACVKPYHRLSTHAMIGEGPWLSGGDGASLRLLASRYCSFAHADARSCHRWSGSTAMICEWYRLGYLDLYGTIVVYFRGLECRQSTCYHGMLVVPKYVLACG